MRLIFARQASLIVFACLTVWNGFGTHNARALKIVIKAIHANALSTLWCLLAALVFIAFYAKMSAFRLTLDTVLVLIAGLTLARFVFVFIFDALAFLLIRARSFVRTFTLCASFSILAAVDTVRNGF